MNLKAILENVKTVGITGHVRPDGDCTGSTLALFNYIKTNFKNVEPVLFLEYTDPAFDYLNGINEIKHEPVKGAEFDVFFVLDCATIDRIKPFAEMYETSKKKVCIDHHVSNAGSFADVNEIQPEASSTCEVLYGLLEEDKITKDVAECLYTGIIHDTGVFKYECTSDKTLSIAGKLINYGFDFTSIIDNSFYARSFEASKALGIALSKSVMFDEGFGIYSILTPEDVESVKAKPSDLGGIVEQLRLTSGVEIAVFIYPGDGAKKVSLRSKKMIDVSRLAESYGGGGHVRAAGFSSFKGYDEILESVFKYVKDEKEKADV